MTTEETRTKDGVKEHCHDDHPYWHPADRVQGIVNEGNRSYEQLLKSLGNPEYIRHGTTEFQVDYKARKLYPVGYLRTGYEPTFDTVPFVARDDLTAILFHERYVEEAIIEANRFRDYYAPPFGDMMDALISKLEEDGISADDARKLIDLAQRICRQWNSEYDLIRLPSGGHVPAGILEEYYEVSAETLARIPRGKDRDEETFICPICKEKSFFAGVCKKCHLTADNSEVVWHKEKLLARKAREHNEILQIVKSGNWSQCRFIRG